MSQSTENIENTRRVICNIRWSNHKAIPYHSREYLQVAAFWGQASNLQSVGTFWENTVASYTSNFRYNYYLISALVSSNVVS